MGGSVEFVAAIAVALVALAVFALIQDARQRRRERLEAWAARHAGVPRRPTSLAADTRNEQTRHEQAQGTNKHGHEQVQGTNKCGGTNKRGERYRNIRACWVTVRCQRR
jgi:hypothetical protein